MSIHSPSCQGTVETSATSSLAGCDSRHRPQPLATGSAMVVASLLVALSGNVAGAADLDSSSRSPSTHATDDGFTRDSLAELGRAPVSPHPSAPIAATTRLKHSRLDGKDFVAHTDGKDFNPATAHRHPGTTRSREGRLAAQTHKRRNPVQSFIYGWNGWVLRTFHTKFGTVLLSRIGART